MILLSIQDRRCLVVQNRQPQRETWLVPLDEADGVPTRDECIRKIEACFGDLGETDKRKRQARAEGIVRLIEHYVSGRPYPVR